MGLSVERSQALVGKLFSDIHSGCFRGPQSRFVKRGFLEQGLWGTDGENKTA